MNINKLPEKFINNTKELFNKYLSHDDFNLFLDSLSADYVRGIRYNTLKVGNQEEFNNLLEKIYVECGIDPVFDNVKWSDDGLYIPMDFFPGRHFYYNAGLFYIQEPSAMLPANVLSAKPYEKILDLCAAPGGKTVKIAADMKGEGILFSNDINETRVKALVRNVELMGCTNCVVLNESPKQIADILPLYFDKVLLDAPCSGEGMFRRDIDAPSSWENFGNDSCVIMQKEILYQVDRLLKPDGILVYSTCTFSTKENEDMIAWFCNEYPWYEILPIEKADGVDNGFPVNNDTIKTARIFPHHAKGEGHFCAKLKKRSLDSNDNSGSQNISLKETIDSLNTKYSNCEINNKFNKTKISNFNKTYNSNNNDNDNDGDKNNKLNKTFNSNNNINSNNSRYNNNKNNNNKYNNNRLNNDASGYNGNKPNNKKLSINSSYDFTKDQFMEAFYLFSRDVLTTQCVDKIFNSCKQHFQIVNGHVYTLPAPIPSLDGLKIAKKGWYLGEIKNAKGKFVFEPSHSFLLTLKKSDLLRYINFNTSDPMLLKYMKGETIFYPQIKEAATSGFIPICVDDYPLGWGKIMDGEMIKNLYPQGWRKS